MSSVAGLFSTLPFSSNREPWHGQSQERSVLFHCSAQPICGHRGTVGLIRFKTVSVLLRSSCLCKILRDGENNEA